MSGFKNDVIYADNIDLSNAGQFSANGELLIGSTVAPYVRKATLTAGPNITITNGNGTITIESTGGGGGGVASVSGTANRITSSGGANPVIDIAATYVGQASITTLGTVATGTWQATTVGTIYGGTGLNSYTTGDTLYASASNTLSKLAISTTSGAPLISDGTIPVWSIPSTYVYYFDDLIGEINASAPFSVLGWSRNAQVGGGISNLNAVTGRVGVVSCTLGTSAGASAGIYCGTPSILFGDGDTRMDFQMQIPTLSDATDEFRVRAGFGDNTTTGAFTDGAYFEYTHGTNGGNWQILTANNNARDTQNTGTAANTNWNTFTIICNAGGTSVAFYINGVQVTNSPITTQIPTGAGRNFGFDFQITRVSGSSNSRSISVDWASFYKKFTTPR